MIGTLSAVGGPVNDLLEEAKNKLNAVSLMQMAHEVSFEYHYKMNAWLGGVATVTSSIVGAGVFAALVSQVGLKGESSVAVHPGPNWLYWTVLVLSLASPALTGWHTFRHDAEDATMHQAKSQAYKVLQSRLEGFLRHEGLREGAADTLVKEAEGRFDKIARKISDEMATTKLGLTDGAYRAARRRLTERAPGVKS